MDTIEYQTIWSGNTWRSFLQPQIATAPPVHVVVRTQQPNSRGLVLAQVTDDWQTALQVGKRAGLSPACVREWLMSLWREGKIERRWNSRPVYGSGRRGCEYRRRPDGVTA